MIELAGGSHPFVARQNRIATAIEGIKKGGTPPEALLIVCQDGAGWQDIYYYTGFTGTSGAFLLVRGEPLLIVDPRYIESASKTAACRVELCTDIGFRSPLQAALDHISRAGVSRLAYGGTNMPNPVNRVITTVLGDSADMVDVSSLIFVLRRRKTAREVSMIRLAAETAANALSLAMREVRAGMSERSFAALLAYKMYEGGADFFDPPPIMVASGERTAMPHAFPSARRFRQGDLVLVDFGARCGGYVCDITRMFSIGPPSREAANVFALLVWAQAEAAARLRPGATARSVDEAARGILVSAGLGTSFTHGLGHGIGLMIHEPPSIGPVSDAVLSEGDVVTLEPGIYRKGEFGLRVEDDYLITCDGAAHLSGELNRELFIV